MLKEVYELAAQLYAGGYDPDYHQCVTRAKALVARA